MRRVLFALAFIAPLAVTANPTRPSHGLINCNRSLSPTQCMACSIYFEARGESLTEKTRVANVIFNRTKSPTHPTTVCGVVHQKSQFSWTLNRVKVTDQAAWDDAVRIATRVLMGREQGMLRDNTGGAVFYHDRKIRPHWSKSGKLRKVVDSGPHVYYTVVQ